MLRPDRSDRSAVGLVRPLDVIRVRSRNDRESGQAMVEFALILFPLLLLVAGIIQFGIALNFWLDEQRIANQGARWAVFNGWPNCPLVPKTPACTGTTVGAGNSLDTYLTNQALSEGMRNNVTVSVCYPDDGDNSTPPGAVGTPVRVRLLAPFELVPLLGWDLTLRGEATMRLEQEPTHLDPATPDC